MAAPTTVDSSLVLFSYSTDSGVTYKTVVCESDSNIEGSRNVVTDETKCGILKYPGPANFRVTFNGVVDSVPDATEASYTEIQAIFAANTKVYAKYTNVGTEPYHQGQGWFTRLGNQNAASGTSKFSFDFEFDGDVDVTA